jgi:hypothetical protein
VKVLNSKGIANRTGSESCVAHREMRDEALTGEPAGQPLSRESFKSVQGADAVSVAEGNTERCDSASVCSALRGLRPWHVGFESVSQGLECSSAKSKKYATRLKKR